MANCMLCVFYHSKTNCILLEQHLQTCEKQIVYVPETYDSYTLQLVSAPQPHTRHEIFMRSHCKPLGAICTMWPYFPGRG